MQLLGTVPPPPNTAGHSIVHIARLVQRELVEEIHDFRGGLEARCPCPIVIAIRTLRWPVMLQITNVVMSDQPISPCVFKHWRISVADAQSLSDICPRVDIVAFCPEIHVLRNSCRITTLGTSLTAVVLDSLVLITMKLKKWNSLARWSAVRTSALVGSENAEVVCSGNRSESCDFR